MNLGTEHLELGEDGIQHTRFQHLQDHNRHPEYVAVDTVASESSDSVYLVGVVDALTKPFARADVVEDSVLLGVCSCGDFFYRRSNGDAGRDDPLDLGEWSCCKHLSGGFMEYDLYNRNTEQ